LSRSSLTMAAASKKYFSLRLLLASLSLLRCDAFQSGGHSVAVRRTALNVLSPRQLQFWEDVEGKKIA
jgi:hypothetical protein